MNKKILAASVAAVMMGSAGLATAAVTIEDKGQLLLSPMFIGAPSHKTDITIWNTSSTAAVKAKMILRSHCDSAEVLDFVIYLSPSDVWRGTVMSDGTATRLVTADDSTKIEADLGLGSAWNNVVPANFPLYSDKLVARPTGALTASCVGQDSNDWGHFEVIGVYSVDNGAYTVDGTPVTVARGMTKPALALILDHPDANSGPRVPRAGNVAITVGGLGAEGVRSADPTTLNIAGRVDIVNMVNGARSSFNIPALAATATAEYVSGVNAPAEQDDYVISNEVYDADTGADSFVGTNFADTLAAVDTPFIIVSDTVGLIEDALADDAEQWAYEADGDNGTGIIVSAPTRYRHIGVVQDGACDTLTVAITDTDNEYSAPFALANGSIQYILSTLDNSENLVTSVGGATSGGVGASPDTLPDETNYLNPNYAFDSGLADMVWTQQNVGAPCTYTGMPMLVTALRYKIEGGAATKYELNHAVTR